MTQLGEFLAGGSYSLGAFEREHLLLRFLTEETFAKADINGYSMWTHSRRVRESR